MLHNSNIEICLNLRVNVQIWHTVVVNVNPGSALLLFSGNPLASNNFFNEFLMLNQSQPIFVAHLSNVEDVYARITNNRIPLI